MDIRHFFGVMRRFKWLVLGGIVAGAFLAAMAYGNPTIAHGKPTIVPRGSEVFSSNSEILINATGDPYGRSAEQYTPSSARSNVPSAPIGDQTYMSGLAPIYAALANGDQVQSEIHAIRPAVAGTVQASAAIDENLQTGLPIVSLTATATSPTAARTLAARAAYVLENYVAHQQSQASISGGQRILLQTVQSATPASLVQGHKITTPALVFFAIFMGVIALALVLENVKPRAATPINRRGTADTPVRALNGDGERELERTRVSADGGAGASWQRRFRATPRHQ